MNVSVQRSRNEAKCFSDALPQCRANPEFFTRFQQAKIVQRVFTNAQERIFIPERADARPRTLRLGLSRESLKQKSAPEAPKEDKH